MIIRPYDHSFICLCYQIRKTKTLLMIFNDFWWFFRIIWSYGQMILWSYDHMVKWSCNHIVIMWSYDHEVIWSCKHMIVWSNITVLSVAILVQDFLGSSISGPNLFSTIIWSVLLYCCTKLVSSCCLNFIILSGMAPKALYIYWKFFALHDPPRFLMIFKDFTWFLMIFDDFLMIFFNF